MTLFFILLVLFLFVYFVFSHYSIASEKQLIEVMQIWDNVAFHYSRLVTVWFDAHQRMMSIFLAPYFPFLNTIEEFSQPGDERFLTIVHRTKCPSCMQKMLHTKTSQRNTHGRCQV